jgi:ankyrin repeat protein
LELILRVAEFLRSSDLLNLIQGFPQIAPLLHIRHIQAHDEDEHNILYLIVEQGLDELIEPLARWIPKGPRIPENEGWTPLHQAIAHANEADGTANQRMVKALVRAGSDLSAQDQHGKTALHLACDRDAVEIIRFLLDHGADPSAMDHRRETPLHEACGKNLHMLFDANMDPSPRDMSLRANPESAVRMLLEAGADPCIRNKNGSAVLHKAAAHDVANCMRLFLEFGADITLRDAKGRTPFMVAALYGSDQCLQILLSAGSKVGDRDNDGCTALHLAALAGRESSARRLVKLGLYISARDNRGDTPMRYAFDHGRGEVMRILEDARTRRVKRAMERMRSKR